MSAPSAKVICDSISESGHRLTTMEVTIHRFVLAEMNTHRVFSRNSASSRAIPLAKQLDKVYDEPAMPVVWAAEQKGMQGGEEVEFPGVASTFWIDASEHAAAMAAGLGELGVHKSIANRLLEPFLMHTVVVSATAWQNFFAQRCSPLAQPEIRVAAEMMKAAYDASTPVALSEQDWHTPYIDDSDFEAVFAAGYSDIATTLAQVSAARCARVSYLTQDGKRDFQEDLALYDRLTSADPMHASPLEHVARPEPRNEHFVSIPVPGPTRAMHTMRLPRYGNLLGWHQLRFDVEAGLDVQAFS